MATKKLLNFENFEIEKINRVDIKKAPYNPRQIDEKNLSNLKKYIKKKKLLMPSIIINKKTGNLISGHQRLSVLDSLSKGADYQLTAIYVNMSQKDEVEANVKLNSSNLSGDWDVEKLFNLGQEFKIDFEKDLAFESEEIDLMFSELDEYVNASFEEDKEVYTDYEESNKAKLKEAKEKYRERMKVENAEGDTIYSKDDNYTLTFIFKNNTEKEKFMKSIKEPKTELYLQSEILFDIYDHKFSLTRGK